jgi:hypothetical protein
VIQIAEHFRKLINQQEDQEEIESSDNAEPFLILGHDLRGFFNKSNPFRSQLISTEKTQLLSSIVKTNKTSSSLTVDRKSKPININNFTITSEGQRSSRNWAELIKSSFERNTLKMANSLRRTTRTQSGVSFSNPLNKTFQQSDYIASKFLQHVMNKKSSSKVGLERKTLQGLNKILKKTRTPILNFIDNKNFIIAGADYLRVYHFSENLW